jgi:hypothetical protein
MIGVVICTCTNSHPRRKMRIEQDNDAGTWTLTSTNAADRALITDIVARVSSECRTLAYRGRSTDDDRRSTVLRFNISGTPQEEQGGFSFELRPDGESDHAAFANIRDTCFFSTEGLLVIESSKSDGQMSLVCTGRHCTKCGTPMIGLGAKSPFCDPCAEKHCDHTYKTSLLHGGTAGEASAGLGCTKCLRMHPDERKRLAGLSATERAQETIDAGLVTDFIEKPKRTQQRH